MINTGCQALDRLCADATLIVIHMDSPGPWRERDVEGVRSRAHARNCLETIYTNLARNPGGRTWSKETDDIGPFFDLMDAHYTSHVFPETSPIAHVVFDYSDFMSALGSSRRTNDEIIQDLRLTMKLWKSSFIFVSPSVPQDLTAAADVVLELAFPVDARASAFARVRKHNIEAGNRILLTGLVLPEPPPASAVAA